MESYIPLVKAIIISAMYSWGTSSTTITEKYILHEKVIARGHFEPYKVYSILDIRPIGSYNR
jgi:hypothetical protein